MCREAGGFSSALLIKPWRSTFWLYFDLLYFKLLYKPESYIVFTLEEHFETPKSCLGAPKSASNVHTSPAKRTGNVCETQSPRPPGHPRGERKCQYFIRRSDISGAVPSLVKAFLLKQERNFPSD